jgi:hypothetical protein
MVPWPTHLVHDADDQLASHAGISAAALAGSGRRAVSCVLGGTTLRNDKMSSWHGQYFIFSDAPLQKSSSKARATDLRGALRGFRDSRTHHPRTVPLPDAVRDCSNERAHRLTR